MMKKIDAYFKLTYGIYLVSCAHKDESNAYIANTVFQVSSKPEKFAISCHKENFSTNLIDHGKAFGVSVLQKDTPLEFIQRYGYQSAATKPKSGQLNYKLGVTGVPIVYDYTVAWFECQVEQKVDVGTHWLFIGRVVDYGLLSSSEEVLDYKFYREHHKAASPSKAPTYVAEESESATVEEAGLKSYACAICEYIYHPSRGDAARGISAGTSFDDLPDDWVCPVCGAGKMLFTESSATT